MVPPCFARPSRRRALPGAGTPWRCDGRPRHGLWTEPTRRPCGSGAMFGAAFRTRFQLPGLSVPYLRAYSPHHCLYDGYELFGAAPIQGKARGGRTAALTADSADAVSLTRQSGFVNGAICTEWEGTKPGALSLPTKPRAVHMAPGGVRLSRCTCFFLPLTALFRAFWPTRLSMRTAKWEPMDWKICTRMTISTTATSMTA